MRVNGKGPQTELTDGILKFGERPEDMEPDIYLVELRYRPRPEPHNVFDRLWVVVNSPVTLARFNKWLDDYVNVNWALALHPPFSRILPSGKSPDPNTWHDAEWKSTYLHHDAVWNMRSKPVKGGHGHQACYDANRNLIMTTIAAGTADFYTPYIFLGIPNWTNHRDQDVYPYIRALQLDGNPVFPTNVVIPEQLNRPCLHEGVNTHEYIRCRPVLPTGFQ